MPPPPFRSLSTAALALLTGARSPRKSKLSYIGTNKKLSKASTATEHTTSSSSSGVRLLTGLPISLFDDDDNLGILVDDNDLEVIVALLLWMSQDFLPTIPFHEIHHAVLGAVIKCGDTVTGGAFGLLHTASVAKLSKLIDIMMLHKNGSPKDANQTLAFMRSCAAIRDTMLQSVSRYNATERVELDTNDVLSCYQRYGRNLIKQKLLAHLKNHKRYWLQNKIDGDTHLSGFQRSFVDSMLRRALGDKKVAMLIWQHGLPRLADLPVQCSMGMLQSSLDECILWYISLANHLAAHQSQEGSDIQVSVSSLDEQERQRQRLS